MAAALKPYLTNRHPVDQLADVRAEIKHLQAVEETLREALLKFDADLSGSEYYARIVSQTRSTPDRKLLDARFGHDAVEACCKHPTFQTIKLIRRDDDTPL